MEGLARPLGKAIGEETVSGSQPMPVSTPDATTKQSRDEQVIATAGAEQASQSSSTEQTLRDPSTDAQVTLNSVSTPSVKGDSVSGQNVTNKSQGGDSLSGVTPSQEKATVAPVSGPGDPSVPLADAHVKPKDPISIQTINYDAGEVGIPLDKEPSGLSRVPVQDSPASALPQAVSVPSPVGTQPAEVAAVQEDYVLRAEPKAYPMAYSERNPPANIQAFKEHEEERQEASRKYMAAQEDSHANASADHEGARAGATEDVPIGAEKSNVLFQPTPTINFDAVFETLAKDTVRIAWVVFASIVVLDALFIGGGIRGLFKSLFPASGMAGIVFYVLSSVGKSAAERKMAQSKPKTEKLRYVPESVEWMNSLTQTVWNVIQEEFFGDMATMVNDMIKPYIPEGVPASVKILKLGHGKNAARVLSMRSLPDEEFGELVPKHGDDHSGSAAERKRREEAVEREEGGIFYNLEIAVAYHASPNEMRTNHMHVDILAMLGPVPLPIFVEVKEFVATIRIRLQMHPDMPFLKNATFALVEPPKINSAVSLVAPWTLDLLNLPIIDNFLESQINTLAKDFVQPRSMSVDMTLFLGGSDLKTDTETIGVLCVKIHRAVSLARQDSRGPGADPYLTIAFSKYEKPMYATRIIKGDLNPVWEESAIILIKPEHVKRQENVLLRLWDSDTMGSDDICGACEFPLQDLMLKPSKMTKRKDQLQGDVAGTDADGILEWEVGYFPRAEYRKELRTDAQDPRDAHGDKMEVKEADEKQDAQNTVPDPTLPSGILELTIHQCINIQVDNPNKKSMGKVAAMHQDSDGEDDKERDGMTDVGYIPTLYVTADINDRLSYRTRVKSLTNAPTFNSTTEQYVRDWRVATLTVGVWDTRKKTKDCLVGLVSLKISDIFHEASSSVKFYDLVGGEGSGRVRLSMIFRSMDMKLDKSLLGFEVGTFTFTSPLTVTGDVHHHALSLKGSGSSRRVKSSKKGEGEISRIWTLDKDKLLNRLPIRYRYHSPVVLEFASAGISDAMKGPLGRQKQYAVLWLFKLIDNQSTKFTLPIYKTDNPSRFIQNVVTQPDETMSLEKVGEVSFVGRFTAGLDESFEEFIEGHDAWTTFTTWQAAREAASIFMTCLRGEYVPRTTNATVEKLAQGIDEDHGTKV